MHLLSCKAVNISVVLLLLIGVISCQSPSWGQVNYDKFQSNNIQFTKPHKEWTQGFENNVFDGKRNVAFDVNRGKLIVFDDYGTYLSLNEVDLVNGTTKVLKYRNNGNLGQPQPSNIVIDGKSNLYVTISDDFGVFFMVKVDLTSSTIQYQNITYRADRISLSEDSNFLIATQYGTVYVYYTSNLQTVWSREIETTYGDAKSLVIGNDLYICIDHLNKIDIRTGALIGSIQVPYSVASISYTGLPGWLALGMTQTTKHEFQRKAFFGIVNVDLQILSTQLLLSQIHQQLPPYASNVVSSLQVNNNSTIQINSVLHAATGGKASYFGISTTFTVPESFKFGN